MTTGKNDLDRETKILNLLCNISLLLMMLITEAFSEIFTNISKEMITAITTSLGSAEDSTKNIEDL
jgi:hypothetical protein